MRRYDGLASLTPDEFRDPVVTIGVFDGVHRGHHRVLERTLARAQAVGGEAVVVTFDVHPRVVVDGSGPPMLTSLQHRLVLLERHGIAATVVLHFDEQLRRMPASTFVDDVLLGRIGIRALVLGPDGHFGRDRGGNVTLARERLAPHGIPVESVDPVADTGERVSSTGIRAAVAEGDLARAALLLGRPVAVVGEVVRGDGRGRELGFPTANLDLHGELRPPRGVYIVEVALDDGWRPALCNIGGRPTFHPEGAAADTVEVWVPDWSGDLYGRELEIRFHERLRGEQAFDGPAALRAQIERDHAAMVEWVRQGSSGLEPGSAGE